MKSNFLTIVKKELTRFFTDRKLFLTTVILPGLMIYIIYSLMGSVFGNLFNTSDDYVSKISVVNMSENLDQLFQQSHLKYKKITEEKLSAARKKISSGDLDACIVLPKDFDAAVDAYDVSSGNAAPEIQIYYNSGKTSSAECYQNLTTLLDGYETSIVNKFDINTSKHDFDLVGKDSVLSKFMYALIPMLFLVLLFSGCCGTAPDSIAGEKERGTIATLLVTPMKRSSLALGKIFSMSIITILSGLSSFIGIILSFPKMMGGNDSADSMLNLTHIGISEYALLLLLILSVVLVLISIVSVISANANSVKEAATTIGPLNIVIIIVGMAGGYLGSSDTNLLTNLIPLYNFSKCMSLILSGTVDVASIVITLVANAVYTGVCTWVLAKMFNSEKIMFSK